MVEDIILANSDRKELGVIQNSNITVDVNGKYEFSVQIARSNWYADLDLASYVYITGTEYGGIVGEVLTDTTLDYVELKGLTWRGRLQYKVIEPPSGSDYKTVSGELNQVMKTLIEPEFDGLFKVSTANTGVSVKNYQFDRYCTLLGGLTKMLKSVGHLRIFLSAFHPVRGGQHPQKYDLMWLTGSGKRKEMDSEIPRRYDRRTSGRCRQKH